MTVCLANIIRKWRCTFSRMDGLGFILYTRHAIMDWWLYVIQINTWLYTLKNAGLFNPILGQIWTNSNIGLKMSFKNVTQWLGLSIFDQKLG